MTKTIPTLKTLTQMMTRCSQGRKVINQLKIFATKMQITSHSSHASFQQKIAGII